MRESPSVIIMELLRAKGADVSYSDPHVPVFPRMRDHKFDLASVELTRENLSAFDLVVLATDHEKFDFNLIKDCAELIVDTRGVYSNPSTKIVKA